MCQTEVCLNLQMDSHTLVQMSHESLSFFTHAVFASLSPINVFFLNPGLVSFHGDSVSHSCKEVE